MTNVRAYVVKGKGTAYHAGRRFVFPAEVVDRSDLGETLQGKPKDTTPSQARAFLASFDVVSERLANLIGDVFRPLIADKAYFPVLAATFIVGIAFPALVDAYGAIPRVKALNLNAAGIGLTAITMFFGLSALLIFHEFGHAAACRRVGIRSDGMGVGFYLFMPSFYTKLSLVKLLSRRERIVVYSCGVYFQMLASIVLTAAAWLLQERALLNLVHLNNITILLNLMPVARFDGHKIMDEFSDWIEARDPYRLVRALVVVMTAAYMLHICRALIMNISRFVTGALHGALTPTITFFGLLSVLGVLLFARSVFKMIRASLARA